MFVGATGFVLVVFGLAFLALTVAYVGGLVPFTLGGALLSAIFGLMAMALGTFLLMAYGWNTSNPPKS